MAFPKRLNYVENFLNLTSPDKEFIMEIKGNIRFIDWKKVEEVLAAMGTGSASSEGCTIRQVEILSNKLLTTAFEASPPCITVMQWTKRRQQGCRDSYPASKYSADSVV